MPPELLYSILHHLDECSLQDLNLGPHEFGKFLNVSRARLLCEDIFAAAPGKTIYTRKLILKQYFVRLDL